MERQPEQQKPETTPSWETLALWGDVGRTLEKSNIVRPRDAAASLGAAVSFLVTSPDAGRFAEIYLERIVAALLGRDRDEMGQEEREFTEEALSLSIAIVIQDLREKSSPAAGECAVLGALALLLRKESAYYKRLPHWADARNGSYYERTVGTFKANGGFAALAKYLSVRVGTSQFPALKIVAQCILPMAHAFDRDQRDNAQQETAMERDISAVALGLMRFFVDLTEDQFPEQQLVLSVISGLWEIFRKLAASRIHDTLEFFELWREFAKRLIASRYLPMAALRWNVILDLIKASALMRPPPKAFVVSGAGTAFINGRYEFSGSISEDGYHVLGSETAYTRIVDNGLPESEGGGKKLTLFRCVMRSQQKWWFISEADEDQPGTDRDIDYYQHKQREMLPSETPPETGWVTCRAHWVDPPPTLQANGLIVPTGGKFNTMEHEFVKWAFKHGVIKHLLGISLDQEIESVVVAMLVLIAFNPETVQMLVELYPLGASSPDEDGRLPLHTLLTSHGLAMGALEEHISEIGISPDDIQSRKMDWRGTVAAVLRAYPGALQCFDGKTHLCPFMLAATIPTIPLDTVYFLLRENPSLVRK